MWCCVCCIVEESASNLDAKYE
jgi:hypothetical protein